MNPAYSSHYSNGMVLAILRRWAQKAAAKINKDFPISGNYYPILTYSGMSGISHAILLANELERSNAEYGMLYVRKINEVSHGASIEYSHPDNHEDGNNKIGVLVFVDDFFVSGKTVFYTLWAGFRRIKKRNYFVNKVQMTYDDGIYVAFGGDKVGNYVKVGTERFNDLYYRSNRYGHALRAIINRKL